MKDIVGQRFGKLVALESTNKRSGGSVVWKCFCNCRKEHFVSNNNLQNGSTRSCGCNQWSINNINITPILHEFLEGNLLGDGGIYITKGHNNARYQHASKYDLLINWYKTFFYSKGIYSGNVYKHITPWSIVYHFNTRTYVELTKYRYRWYPEGKKIVPPDLELTPDVLLWWYVGDGSCSNRSATSEITLATNGFEEQYVNLLVSKLKEKNIEATKHKTGKKKQYTIYIRSNSIKKFFDYMSPLPEDLQNIYGYKWDFQLSPKLLRSEQHGE